MYFPEALDDDVWTKLQPTLSQVEVLNGPERAEAVVYNQVPPGQWYIRWRLNTGAFYTHVRHEDTYELVPSVVSGVTVDLQGPNPVVFLDRSLQFGARQRPGYEETISFIAPPGSDREALRPALVFRRPSWVRGGEERVELVGDGTSSVMLGADKGIDVRVSGFEDETDARVLAERMLQVVASMY